jgi:hypothetical protein
VATPQTAKPPIAPMPFISAGERTRLSAPRGPFYERSLTTGARPPAHLGTVGRVGLVSPACPETRAFARLPHGSTPCVGTVLARSVEAAEAGKIILSENLINPSGLVTFQWHSRFNAVASQLHEAAVASYPIRLKGCP